MGSFRLSLMLLPKATGGKRRIRQQYQHWVHEEEAMIEAKPYPMNAWYATAWDYEIKGELTPRTICDKDIVLYRRSDGQAVALEDACWH